MPSDSRWNWPALLGPVLGVVGVLSYFTVFYWWPVVRDVPWANYAILVLALALASMGLHRALGRGALRVSGAALSFLLTLACSVLFMGYIHVYSYELPGEDRALPLDAPLPALTLLDDRGEEVELAALDGPLVLVFYRGFW